MTRSTTYLLGCPTKRQPFFLNRIPNKPIQKGRHLSVLAISILLVALIALPGIACADDFVGGIPLSTVQTGTVTGDLWFNATPAPDWGSLDVTKTFTLPENTVGNITWARLYISAYDGHMQDDKAFTITNKFDGNGDGTYEQVWPETGHAPFNFVMNATTYELEGNDNTALGGGAHDRYKMINDHENRVTSDYFMWYDVTNQISSRTVNVNVNTAGSFDGRIKMITLVVAYNDPTSATLTTYYVNQGHDVCSYYTENQGGADDGSAHVAVGSTTFATTGLSGISSATLTVDYMASNNGNYGFPTAQNNFDPSTKTGDFTNINLDRTADVQGAYSGLDHWDVTSSISGSSTTTFAYARYLPGSGTAAFYKIPLAFLVVKSPIPAVTPVAAFTANITSGTEPLTVQFTDQSTNTPTSWSWDFGDGSTSTEQNPAHEYTAAGTYTVALTATNSAGSNAVTQTDYITVAAAGSKTWDIYPTDPDGTLDLIMTNVSAGDTVYFHNGNYPTTILGSSHVYNSVPNIIWVGESRDGVIINIGSSSLILQQPGYIFKNLTFTQTAAVYSWSVRSSDDLFDNCNFNWTSGGSTAPIIILANSAGTGEHCTITNSTFSNYTDSPISVYSGMDHVIAGNTFRSETKSLIRMANTSSTAWFYLNNVVGTQPKSVLRSTSVAVPTFVSPSAITYTYNGNSYTNVLGNYWPDYNGTDSDGNGIGDTAFVNGSATDTAPLMGVWNNGAITYTASGVVAPVANFTATPTSGTAPLAVTFTDTSTNSPISWSWDFGDGSTSTEQNPSHEYTTAGTYTVALTATNAAGSDGETKTGYVTVISAVGGLADTAWPKFQGNAKNTGLSPYIGPQTSNVLWNTTTGTIYYAAPVIGSDGTVYIGSYTAPYNVYAVNADGTIKWTYLTGGKIYSSAAVGSDGTIYIGSSDNKLYAINADGTLKWSYTAGGAIRSSVAIGTGGTIFFVSMDDYIYALNSDGSLKWKYNVNAYGPYYGSPTIGSDGTIYLGNSNDNTTYALNADGTLKWTYVTEGYIFNSPTVGTDGTIYLGSTDKKMYALNADGTLKWAYTTNDEIYDSPAIGTDGTIYFGSRDYNVYALNADGTLKWSYPTGNYVQSSPVIGSDGTIYLGSFDYNVYALNADGTLKWSYTTGNSVRGSAAIGSDGTLFIGSSDGKLYAFRDAAAVVPVANFTATPVSGTAPLMVQFTDASTNTPTSWAWTFGDGVTSTTQNPVHEYTVTGTYTVTLTATNSAGYDIEEKTGYITVSAAPATTIVNLSADADSYIRWGTDYADTNFGTATVLSTWIHSLAGSAWGRSLIHFDLSPIPEGATIESATLHAYKSAYKLAPNVYAYRITNPWTESTVTWNSWDSNTSIAAAPSAVATTTAAKEWVSWDLTSDVQAYVSGTAPNYGWMLNLSDTTRPTAEIKATFNSRENSANNPYLLVVYSTESGLYPPVAAFTGTPVSGTAPLMVQFTDASANVPTSWSWDFGDGNTTNATEQNPVHTYTTAGNYTVKLTATNGAGSDTVTETDYITVIPLVVIALPGQTNVPTDPDGDGLYEDLTGNGKLNYLDLQEFFTNMDWIAENEPVALFDFSGNNKIGYTDLQKLFARL